MNDDLFWFYAIKGVISLVSVVVLVIHMATIRENMRAAKIMRYICLLGSATLITAISGRQMKEMPDLQLENIASFCLSIFILITVIVSIHDEKVRR